MSKKTFTKPGPKTIITNDYDMFEPFEFNRDVRKTRQICESMKTFGFDEGSVINCRAKANGKLQIIQGHHRFEVAKGLGVPVAAVIAESEVPVWALERGTHPWNVTDFCTGFAREGRKEYQQVLDFSENTGISCGASIALMQGAVAGGVCYSDRAKQGDMNITHREHADRIGHIVKRMKGMGHRFAPARLFITALSKCFLVEGWDDNRWLAKAKTHGALLERQPDEARYLDMIQAVYNRHCKEESQIPIAFLAKKQANAKMVTALKNGKNRR
ncbi:MAG: ParB N-terminal domain-containing protein [Gammaproteobacteria bacterium]|nr:ParB N-terminal domain-containing protein [Gammaproteobacteria bacterium]